MRGLENRLYSYICQLLNGKWKAFGLDIFKQNSLVEATLPSIYSRQAGDFFRIYSTTLTFVEYCSYVSAFIVPTFSFVFPFAVKA